MTDHVADLTGARDEVLAQADSFRLELEPLLASSLLAGLERLRSLQAAHVASLDAPTRQALEDALERALGTAVAAVSTRLRDPDLWLSPQTALQLPSPSPAWPLAVPAWLARLARGRARPTPELGELDDPGNRIWVAITSAAGPLDAVLQEFGFSPERRRIGGGRFGVAPRTLPRLDPSGALQRRWKRYRAAYARYSSVAGPSA